MNNLHNRFPVAAALILGATLYGCDNNNGGGGTAQGPFSFETATPDMYARVDRTAQPATGTALLSRVPSNPSSLANSIATNDRDRFNKGNPATDLNDFAGKMSATLLTIHQQLDPQLRSLGLVTCSTGSNSGTDITGCINQAVSTDPTKPSILPDIMTIDLQAADGWPNGRRFDDPVVDRLLAIALLDLSATGQTVNTLASLPLNPPGNDANANDPSPPDFPYLRPKHKGPGL